MICAECTKGEHCGTFKPVGERTRDCTCQHRHPGAWRGVKETLAHAAQRIVGAMPYDYLGRKETK